MTMQLTSVQKRLTKEIKKNAEKYVRAASQAEYLKECIEKKILPRSINIVKLAKSPFLWENDEANDTFEILFDASVKLLKGQLYIKEKKCGKIKKEGEVLRNTLSKNIEKDKFDEEEERLKVHMMNVYCVERKKTQRTVLRDI